MASILPSTGDRRRHWLFGAVLPVTLMALVVTLSSCRPTPPERAGPRLLLLGDSITEGFSPGQNPGLCGYRAALAQSLPDSLGCAVEFVGPNLMPFEPYANCQALNVPHYARSGKRADEFLHGQPSEVLIMTRRYRPDAVLVHIGSNDLAHGQSNLSTLAEIKLIVQQIRAARPHPVSVLVAMPVPWDPQARPGYTRHFDNPDIDEARLSVELAQMIERWVRSENDPQLLLVDAATGFDNASMTVDGVHPNPSGERHLADAFSQVLAGMDLCDRKG